MIEQLLCHIFGDYWLQSDYLAFNKSKRTIPCLIHVLIYTSCFLLITTSWKALLLIGISHFIFDRWHFIIKRLIWFKNHFPKGYPPYEHCDTTGYFDDSPYNTKKTNEFGWKGVPLMGPRPFFITIWLYIISDNFIHLLINYLAITLLG